MADNARDVDAVADAVAQLALNGEALADKAPLPRPADQALIAQEEPQAAPIPAAAAEDAREDVAEDSDAEDSGRPDKNGFIAFPSIEKLENVRKGLDKLMAWAARPDPDAAPASGPGGLDPSIRLPLPPVKYLGTVKLHGSHSDIVLLPSGEVQFQSRNKVVTPGKGDHAGMAGRLTPHTPALRSLLEQVRERAGAAPGTLVVLAGEWCGPGVQKAVAISELPHAFYAVSARVGGVWQGRSVLQGLSAPAAMVYNVWDFKTWELMVDFADVPAALARAMEHTLEVDAMCPVAKALGKEGVGEGIVWVTDLDDADTPAWAKQRGSRMWFKTKGERHLGIPAEAGPSGGKAGRSDAAKGAKVPNLAGISEEVVAGVAAMVTRGRCMQAIEFQLEEAGGMPAGGVRVGQAASWVANDIVKEEALVLERLGVALPKGKGTVFRVALPVAEELVQALLNEAAPEGA